LSRLITTFDEVPPSTPTIHIVGEAISYKRDHGVTLFKTCTAEVFRPVPTHENRSSQACETRKDSAVHVSLSSSSLVKQPGAKTPPATAGTSKFHSTTNDNRLRIGCSSTHHRRSFTRHENSPWPRAKAAPRSVGRVIGPPDPPCQRFVVNKSSHRAAFFAPRSARALRRAIG